MRRSLRSHGACLHGDETLTVPRGNERDRVDRRSVEPMSAFRVLRARGCASLQPRDGLHTPKRTRQKVARRRGLATRCMRVRAAKPASAPKGEWRSPFLKHAGPSLKAVSEALSRAIRRLQALSSVGRASPSHGGGQRFESASAYHSKLLPEAVSYTTPGFLLCTNRPPLCPDDWSRATARIDRTALQRVIRDSVMGRPAPTVPSMSSRSVRPYGLSR